MYSFIILKAKEKSQINFKYHRKRVIILNSKTIMCGTAILGLLISKEICYTSSKENSTQLKHQDINYYFIKLSSSRAVNVGHLATKQYIEN